MSFLKKLIKAIVKIIVVIAIIVLIVVAAAALVMTGGFSAVVFGIALWKIALIALLAIALMYILDNDTASATLSKTFSKISDVAEDVGEGIGNVVGGGLRGLTKLVSDNFIPLALAGLGSYYLLKKDSNQSIEHNSSSLEYNKEVDQEVLNDFKEK